MLSYEKAFYELLSELKNLYDAQEASAIAHEALEHITGLGRLDRIIRKNDLLTSEQVQQFQHIKKDLSTGRPLQYATGNAWFMNRRFYVNESVLIPRPETEELVAWIAKDHFPASSGMHILDIGTGSGCIPVSLKLALPSASITGCDISTRALETAKRNADRLHTEVQFIVCDILDPQERETLPVYDIIVSNPPYIPDGEAKHMHANVKDHEPHLALFVPDDDPLLFYRTIATFGKHHLVPGGYIYCELHRDHATETKELFDAAGYTTELRKDMHGNWRMLRAVL